MTLNLDVGVGRYMECGGTAGISAYEESITQYKGNSRPLTISARTVTTIEVSVSKSIIIQGT